jgi:hypothetical protein
MYRAAVRLPIAAAITALSRFWRAFCTYVDGTWVMRQDMPRGESRARFRVDRCWAGHRLGEYDSEHAALEDVWFAVEQHGDNAFASIELRYVDEQGQVRSSLEDAFWSDARCLLTDRVATDQHGRVLTVALDRH